MRTPSHVWSILAALLLAAVALAAPTVAAEKSRTVAASGPLKVGEPCPSFAGWTLTGQMLSLNELRKAQDDSHDVVVISFFATWCKPCLQRMPSLMKVVDAMKGKGVKGVLIAYAEAAEVVKPFAAENKIALPVIVDPFTKIAGRLGVDKSLPRTFVVDRQGNVATIFEGEGDDYEQALTDAVTAVTK